MKTIYGKTETRYVLETSASTVSTGNVATVEKPLGELQRRQSVSVPVSQKPRQGPLKPQTGGGAHRDKKKEQKQGKEKHRKPFAEQSVAEGLDNPDHEISMASNELQSIAADAKKLLMLVKRYSEMEGLEAWQQSKITKAADYMTSVLRSIGGEQGALEGRYGRSSWDSSMPSWQDREQDAWDADKRAFKRQELDWELRHEKDEPYRPQRRFSSASSGMYFYNVKPGQESDAMAAGLKQTKNGKWYSKMSNPSADKTFGPGKYWEPKSEGVAEGVDIVDQDSDLDQQVFTLNVDGKTVSFTYWDYENNFQSPAIKDIYQQAREQLGKKLSPEQIKAVARSVFKSFKQGVAEEKQKGVDGKACWKGYKRVGTKKKGGRTVDNCVPIGEDAYTLELFNQLDTIVNEKAPPGDKYERMVKHIKKGYAKDGKLTNVEKRKAYGAAWKAKNKAKK